MSSQDKGPGSYEGYYESAKRKIPVGQAAFCPATYKPKTIRTDWTRKLTYPKDIYKGNVNHWSIQRVLADEYVATQKVKDMEKKGLLPPIEPPPPGMTTAPFIWSRERALSVRAAAKPFYQIVLDGLDGELPGELWKGYGRHVYGWEPNLGENQFHTRALEGYKYWWREDTSNSVTKTKKDRDKLAI